MTKPTATTNTSAAVPAAAVERALSRPHTPRECSDLRITIHSGNGSNEASVGCRVTYLGLSIALVLTIVMLVVVLYLWCRACHLWFE